MTDKDCKKWEKYTERLSKKKTMHKLCKEYPNKTYAELEKYRNADRWEEAQKIFIQQDNEELKEDIGIGHNNPPEDDEEKHEV